ncbi:VWA domain-containing protein [Nitratiruptor tergarcus]|uniref:Ca-activated chloride channel family protein n=1 Tax=Nitratiruptor tergarcus DSM 16512 TaxID=1069081 RepID=A0A1W1WRY8_9BACT|nr:VWA domain-containing protein [Nitratiruptor tergarcus]SMC09081.1 Ca-activated chloride channel family protein [Nitratiruptor tergarcus DSM 16512]
MKFLDFAFIPYMLVPSLILLYLVLTNKSLIDRIFDNEVLAKLRIEQGLSKQLRTILLFGALFLMILAMARPVYQKGIVEVESYRGDVVIALDISRSMKAKDYYPDRLTFAKKKIEEFINKAQNLAIGILAFAENAYIVSPITDDKHSLKYLLKRLDTNLLSLRGTNILSALMSANLLYGNKEPKQLILVTDGGDKKDFTEEIKYAKDHGFKIIVLAVATKKGAPIEEKEEYLKDREGNIVITKLNPDIAKLANETGGLFIQARLDQKDIEQILANLGGIKKEKEVEKVVDQVEFYPYFLTVAFIFLFLAFFDLPSTKALYLLPLLLVFDAHAGLTDFKTIKEAKEAYSRGNYESAVEEFRKITAIKKSPQSYYDLANALYKSGKYKEAIRYYNKVQTDDKELEFRKLHNLGNSYFKLQKYKKAIEMYEKALKIKEDKDTRFNLELAKKMLKKQQQKQKNNQKQNNKKKQQKKQNQKGQKSNEQNKKQQKKQEQNQQQSGEKGEQKEQQNQPISNREEKKWLKMIQKNSAPTLLYKAPIKIKKEAGNENPW